MEFTKDNIEVTTILAGFHLHSRDYNFHNYYGSLLNIVTSLLGPETNVLRLIDQTGFLVNHPDIENLTLKIQDSVMTWEQTPDSKFLENVMQLAEAWNKNLDKIQKFKLIGFLRNFKVKDIGHDIIEEGLLRNSVYKDLLLNGKSKQMEAKLNFTHSEEDKDYNINLMLNEVISPSYSIMGAVDFNRVDDSNLGIELDEAPALYELSEEYFNNDALRILEGFNV